MHTLADFAPVFLEIAGAFNRPSEARSKERILRVHLIPAFCRRPLEAIDYGAIQDYVIVKLRTHAPKSINNHLTVLRRLMVIAQRRRVIEHVPSFDWLKVQMPRIRWLEGDDLERLIAANHGQVQRMIRFAARTGGGGPNRRAPSATSSSNWYGPVRYEQPVAVLTSTRNSAWAARMGNSSAVRLARRSSPSSKRARPRAARTAVGHGSGGSAAASAAASPEVRLSIARMDFLRDVDAADEI